MRRVFCFLMTLSLAGCAATSGTDRQPAPGDTAPAEPAAETAPTPQPAPPPPPPKPVFDPTVFTGMTPDEVANRYGAPTLKRHDGIARVWQYHAGNCVLHLFFYSDGTDAGKDGFHVTHVEAKLRNTAPEDGQTAAEACAGPFGVAPEQPAPEPAPTPPADAPPAQPEPESPAP